MNLDSGFSHCFFMFFLVQVGVWEGTKPAVLLSVPVGLYFPTKQAIQSAIVWDTSKYFWYWFSGAFWLWISSQPWLKNTHSGILLSFAWRNRTDNYCNKNYVLFTAKMRLMHSVFENLNRYFYQTIRIHLLARHGFSFLFLYPSGKATAI